MMKLTPDGTISWTKKADLPTTDFLFGWDVEETPTGFLCLIQTYNNGILLLKTDLSDNVLTSIKYNVSAPNQMEGYPRPKLRPAMDGGFVFLTSGWGYGDQLIKIDSSGNFRWGQMMVIKSSDVTESSDGGFMVLGNGPVMGVDVIPTDQPQIGVIKTDSLGNGSGCIWQNGAVSNPIIVNMANVTTTTTSGGQMSPFHIAMIDNNLLIFEGCVAVIGAVNEQKDSGNPVTVSPNPSDGHFQISVNSGDLQPIEGITVFNSMGEMVYKSQMPSASPIAIDLSAKPDGVYLVQVRIKNKVFSETVLVSK